MMQLLVTVEEMPGGVWSVRAVTVEPLGGPHQPTRSERVLADRLYRIAQGVDGMALDGGYHVKGERRL